MASASRAQFSSRMGFILAAAGSAVGLGNIWGFPTQAASNGGGAFLLVYILMVVVLAYPLLVAELTIGRYGQANPIRSLQAILPDAAKNIGSVLAMVGLIAASCILSFYAILAGWLVGFFVSPLLVMLGMDNVAVWLETFSVGRNLLLMAAFMLATIYVVKNGVAEGIERWSSRLMPVLVLLFVILIGYIFTQEGASDGLHLFLVPDFSQIDASLIHSAMGQAFFSLSLGVCTMMVYGSYLKKEANLPKTAAQVAMIDTGIAIVAGLLVLPAMFVAQKNGVEIYNESGQLASSGTLVFDVLPATFETMGNAGYVVSVIFFALMVIAALTSSISLLEVPVAAAVEELGQTRKVASWIIGLAISVLSVLIIFNFGSLFDLIVVAATEYAQPILGLVFALLVGWVWHRDKVLAELREGNPHIAQGLFWRVWPAYVRIVCPLLMLYVFFAK
ncbi:transporter [Photobacterium aquae]|uniref:Transporter n=1 Tax=Photobacterium aquae TaxID=1195763 RepID=A0A0J1HBQ0_9GAMM|nr:sodium-dependent transporter [Photobacterium aquae]KLV09075.1 transporter [Photobacterium aquae]